MRRRFLLSCIAALGLATAPQAQQWNQIDYYVAEIGPQDFYNSRGVRLGSLGAVLQQDRANVHRFGIRHPRDEIDRVFGNKSLRAGIPAMVKAGGTNPGLQDLVRRGQPFVLSVFVCGYGGVPSVFYLAGFGEDHSGCF